MTSTIPASTPLASDKKVSDKKVSDKLNKFEKFKAEKDGLAVKSELEHFAAIGWEAMDETDRDHRLKWMGVFFRPVTPGKFMMRLRVPSGILRSEQMRVLAQVVQRYGDDGCADITTRQNLQLRGIRLEDVPDIFRQFKAVDLTSIQSGMDNVRNITGSPVAGIDASELIDTRALVQQVQDLITQNGEGNPAFTNLPRKFNIAIEGGRDNSVHAEINDVAFVPAYKNGVLGFNVVIGGFFSATRCEAAIPMDVWVSAAGVVDLCEAILVVFRDNGPRANRQKARLMWLLDEWGVEKFRSAVEAYLGRPLRRAADHDAIDWEKRDHIGVFPQKQVGLNYVGLNVPVGRLSANDMFELARLAEVYGSGELRLTVEQNVILPNVPDSRLEALQNEAFLSDRFSPNPSALMRGLVSCTGKQFCNFAMVDTKNQSVALIRELDAELNVPKTVRIHWTGCPNSCGQPQVADIGFMGTKVKKNGKPAEGVDVFTGGKVGKNAHLGSKTDKGIACDDLKPYVRQLLIDRFGATLKEGVVIDDGSASTADTGVSAPPATVKLTQSGQTIAGTETDTILELVEGAGRAIDSSCRTGSCGTCKHKILSGDVRYDDAPGALTPEEHAQGYVLTCVAHPVGTVELDL